MKQPKNKYDQIPKIVVYAAMHFTHITRDNQLKELCDQFIAGKIAGPDELVCETILILLSKLQFVHEDLDEFMEGLDLDEDGEANTTN